jgi:hypothetical protein
LDVEETLLQRQRECFSLDLADVVEVQCELQDAMFEAGWVRHGWPEDLGGLGGDARHRAAVYDELGRRRVPIPESYLTVETLIPMLTVHAPELARRHLVDLLRGSERWCQGFSEPDAGSDLASLRTAAVRDGEHWIVDGHKIWTSQATVSQRCVVLVRTGTPESRHRGLSMILVDHDAPGVTVRPIRTMSGRDELGEVLFDGVRVDGDRMIGAEGDGWALAMYLLQWQSDGAAALLVVGEEVVDRYTDRPVWVRGVGLGLDRVMHQYKTDMTTFPPTVKAARQAYAMAGVGPADIDVAEVHDCFTGVELIDYEDLGFCERFAAAALVESGATAVGGRLPVNPSGV